MEEKRPADIDVRDLPPRPLYPSPVRYRFVRPPLRERIAAFRRRLKRA
jgi:hypothetical protein